MSDGPGRRSAVRSERTRRVALACTLGWIALGVLSASPGAFAQAATTPSPPVTPSATPSLPAMPTATPNNQAVLMPSEIVTKVRDPFKRPKILENEEGKTELDRVSVDQLRLVGVMNGPSRVRALVKAPSGKTYFVKESMRLGFRDGVVTRISRDAVRVREKVVNILGQEEQVESVLKLELDSKGGS